MRKEKLLWKWTRCSKTCRSFTNLWKLPNSSGSAYRTANLVISLKLCLSLRARISQSKCLSKTWSWRGTETSWITSSSSSSNWIMELTSLHGRMSSSAWNYSIKIFVNKHLNSKASWIISLRRKRSTLWLVCWRAISFWWICSVKMLSMS